MKPIISFPMLGDLSINPPNSFEVFGFSIYWYGVIIAAGFLLAVLYCMHRCGEFGLNSDNVLDTLIVGTPLAIIGARLYYVVFYFDLYRDNLWEIFAIRDGGLAIYGGIIGGFLGIFGVCAYKKYNLLGVLDCIAPGVLIGQIIGRWGNFVNAEAYGVIGPYDFLGHTFDASALAENNPFIMSVNGELVHPTFLYESVWNLIGFLIINAFWKRKKYNGQVLLWYVTWYGLGRCVIEGFRGDSLYVGSLRISQLLALICFVIGVVLLAVMSVRSRRLPKDTIGVINSLHQDSKDS